MQNRFSHKTFSFAFLSFSLSWGFGGECEVQRIVSLWKNSHGSNDILFTATFGSRELPFTCEATVRDWNKCLLCQWNSFTNHSKIDFWHHFIGQQSIYLYINQTFISAGVSFSRCFSYSFNAVSEWVKGWGWKWFDYYVTHNLSILIYLAESRWFSAF